VYSIDERTTIQRIQSGVNLRFPRLSGSRQDKCAGAVMFDIPSNIRSLVSTDHANVWSLATSRGLDLSDRWGRPAIDARSLVPVPLSIPDNQGHHEAVAVSARRLCGCRVVRPQNNNRPSIQHLKHYGQLGGACHRASITDHQTNIRNAHSCSPSKAESWSCSDFGCVRSLAVELAHGRILNRSRLL
jgi:hypothetical protein